MSKICSVCKKDWEKPPVSGCKLELFRGDFAAYWQCDCGNTLSLNLSNPAKKSKEEWLSEMIDVEVLLMEENENRDIELSETQKYKYINDLPGVISNAIHGFLHGRVRFKTRQDLEDEYYDSVRCEQKDAV
jgi:hypothetical protein